MVMVAGYTFITSSKRDDAVDAFREMVARARAQNGCIDFAISADSVDPKRINFFELWRDESTLEAWQKVAGPPDIGTTESHVEFYHVKVMDEDS